MSLASDRSFGSYEQARAHLDEPQLPDDSELYWNQQLLDVRLVYPIGSNRSQFAVHPRVDRFGVNVTTATSFLSPAGAVRTLAFHGDPGLIRFDPSAGHELARRWILAFAFGIVHGFGFSFARRELLQFAGDHLVAARLGFDVGIEIGEIAALLVLVPALGLLLRFVVPERLGIIIVSALAAPTAWPWTHRAMAGAGEISLSQARRRAAGERDARPDGAHHRRGRSVAVARPDRTMDAGQDDSGAGNIGTKMPIGPS